MPTNGEPVVQPSARSKWIKILGTFATLLMAQHFSVCQAWGQKVWNNVGTSSWVTGSNWTPSGAPTPLIDAQINNGGTAQLHGFAGDARDVYLGVGGSTSGYLSIARTSFAGALFSRTVYLGHSGTSTISAGTVNGSGSSWTASTDFFVGYQGQGSLLVQGAGTVQSNRAFIGEASTGSGNVTVTGAGSMWTNTNELRVGNQGSGTLNISSGAAVSSNSAFIGHTGGGSVYVAGGTWTNFSSLRVGWSGYGQLNISSGGTVTNSYGDIAVNANSTGIVNVSGAGSTWINSSDFLNIGIGGNGTLNVTSGGMVSAVLTNIGSANGSVGTATVSGPGSALNSSSFMNLGGSGTGTLTAQDGGAVTIAGFLTMNSGGTLNLFGGVVSASDLWMPASGGAVNFLSGTLRITGNHTMVPTSGVGNALGSNFVINGPRNLTIDGTANFLMPMTLDGGTATFGQLVNPQALDLKRGTLNLTNQPVTIGAGGLFGDQLELKPELTINVTSGVTNNGLIAGGGRLGGPLVNNTAGEIRAAAGNSLIFAGPSATNHGNVQLIGGVVEFQSALTNSTTGRITGRGMLQTGGIGLTNNGHIALSSGITDVYGDVVNSTGNVAKGITVSGNADATFWDDVNNVAGSLFRVSAGSSATFFGTFGGAGISGPGSVYFEADVTPGASPATASFGGSVSFGVASALVIELGGTTPGAQHDQLQVAGALSLDGALQVVLIDSFMPNIGQSFDILDFNLGSLTGTFSSITLPPLTSGKAWNTTQLYTTGMLSVSATLIAGDFDADGDVDGADFIAWQTNFPTPTGATLADGDADGDVDVDGADFAVWQTNFPFTPGAGVTTIPEPAAGLLGLFAFCGLALLARRNGQR